MNFNEYIPLAARTCKELPTKQHVEHMALGIAGEMGEIIDAVKKHKIYGKELDLVNLTEEIGDALYYPANLVHTFGPPKDFEGFDASGVLTDILDPDLLGSARNEVVYTLLEFNASIAQFNGMLLDASKDADDPDTTNLQKVSMALLLLVWGVAALLEVDPYDAMERNIAKLAKRYGDKYSDFKAINRDTDAERQVLEGQA